MKTREILFKDGSRAFHWPDGKMTFYMFPGWELTLGKSEVEKLQKYFVDVQKGNDHSYVPGRAE